MDTLIQLPSFSYTELDFESIISLVKQLIQEHPEYNQNWDDFLESDAGRMVIELTSYIVEKLAARVDWNAQEDYLSSATQRESTIKLLKLINAKPHLPRASKLNVSLHLTKWTSPFQFGVREKISIPDSTGALVNFECIQLANDGKPDYSFQYLVSSGTDSDRIYDITGVPFYQGTTVEDDSFYADGISNESIILQRYPVIENSIRVYGAEQRNGQIVWVECVEVSSFISPEAQQNGVSSDQQVIPYMTEINAENGVTIKFGHESIVKIPRKNQQFKILYRIGGGKNTNVVANALNITKTYIVDNQRISIIMTNPYQAFGGEDAQDLDQLKLTAPLELRTANKTVTREDYITHLLKNTTISLMHANIISKENEPDTFYSEYGYSLPPLDVWIYATPLRDNYTSSNPQYYTKLFKIERPYDSHGIEAHEDFSFTSDNQTVFLKTLFKYKNYTKYVTLFEGEPWMMASSYVEGIDYSINYNSCQITRISTAEGGSIPDGTHKLRIQFVKDPSMDDHKNACFWTFDTNSDKIILDNQLDSLYIRNRVILHNIQYSTKYSEGTDFSVDYHSNTITRISTGDIVQGQPVIVEYSNNYNSAMLSEEKDILSSISNKKMICVDNYVKDSVYSTFDIVGTVYCYKNTKSTVQSNLESYVRNLYSLTNRDYAQSVNKSQIIADIMGYAGVRFIEITYLGRNYNAYKMYVNDVISKTELTGMDCDNYDYEIPCKYNEIFVVNNDAYDGSQIIDNKIAGLVFEYKEI